MMGRGLGLREGICSRGSPIIWQLILNRSGNSAITDLIFCSKIGRVGVYESCDLANVSCDSKSETGRA
jgi:hypothetical protein